MLKCLSELGRGKYGVVHLVEEKETRKYFAMKCIKTRKKVRKLHGLRFVSIHRYVFYHR